MKKYYLTRFGVCLAIEQLYWYDFGPKDCQSKIIMIAKNWTSLEPILFEKWKYLEQKLGEGVGQAFLIFTAFCGAGAGDKLEPEDFRDFVIELCFENLEGMISYYRMTKESERLGVEIEEEKNYFRSAGDNPESSLNSWVKAVRDDPDLNEYLVKYVDSVFEEAKAMVKWGQYLKDGL